MKILIAYDGIDCSKAALDDLVRAGLPSIADAIVLSVGEVLMPPPPSYEIVGADLPRRVRTAVAVGHMEVSKVLDEAHEVAVEAWRRLQREFPNWHISAEVVGGTPSWEIIQKANEWPADLVVVGSHGRSSLGRLIFGSVSHLVAIEANCSVRVARSPVEKARSDAPVSIIIGFDGSPDARATVRKVAARTWPAGSQVRVIFVNIGGFPRAVTDDNGSGVGPTTNGHEETIQPQVMLEQVVGELRASTGLQVKSEIIDGDPRKLLIQEAEKSGSDCIFVGSRGLRGSFERFILGSVSTALVHNAHCSVEVVRASLSLV
jgi:nucleotide-binding universal stress UspA family protein